MGIAPLASFIASRAGNRSLDFLRERCLAPSEKNFVTLLEGAGVSETTHSTRRRPSSAAHQLRGVMWGYSLAAMKEAIEQIRYPLLALAEPAQATSS